MFNFFSSSQPMEHTPNAPNLDYPDELVRLASAVHRFGCPDLGSKKSSFVRSFKTSASKHTATQNLMANADRTRGSLAESLSKATISYETTAAAAKAYIPYINQVLISCKLQPDAALLDERLYFEWKSGIETTKLATSFKSEALMYELAMTVACEALGTGGMGCDASTSGDFTSAGKHFKAAAGMWQYLGQDLLPKWIATGTTATQKELPSEVTTGVADAMTVLYLAHAQQMVMSAALAKSGKPSYSLMAKLARGVAEQIDEGVKLFHTKTGGQMERMDPTFFALLQFQSQYQRALSTYFLARATWEEREYGMAIALMHEATIAMRTGSGGLPDVESKTSPLRMLSKDLAAVRVHLSTILQSWEKDNSTVYFENVPQQVPQNKKLQVGMRMIKEPDAYSVRNADPMPLSIPYIQWISSIRGLSTIKVE